MNQYLDLCEEVLLDGAYVDNRTGTPTISNFGAQMQFCMDNGFPMLTTKKLNFRAIVLELLWFIRGEKDIKYLQENRSKIWDAWADENGEVGEMYGFLWRHWPTRDGGEIDQLQGVIDRLKTNPDCRRLIVSAWNPDSLNKQALACCHSFFQFKSYPISQEYAEELVGLGFYTAGEVPERLLDMQMYQRSADMPIGVPFNIASYSLLLHMVAQMVDMHPRMYIHTLGDYHIYENQIEGIKIQMERMPSALPFIKLNKKITNINDFKIEDIELVNYEAQPHIKMPVSV